MEEGIKVLPDEVVTQLELAEKKVIEKLISSDNDLLPDILNDLFGDNR